MDYVTVYYWPDGCWYFWHELQQFPHRSDDFGTVQVPRSSAEVWIDMLIGELVTNGE